MSKIPKCGVVCEIKLPNTHLSRIQGKIKPYFTGLGCSLGALAFRDVPENEHDPEPFSCVRENGRGTVFDVKFFAVLGEQNRVVGKTYYLSLTKHLFDGILNRAASLLIYNVKHGIHGLPGGFCLSPPGER